MEDRAIFRPTSLAELTGIVAAAVAEEVPLEIVGAGSKRGFGRPVEAKHTLDVSGLAGVDMYEPEELVMSAGAGTPLAQIEAMLAERQQELAFEPADYGAILGGEPGRQTIGGVFACNLSGPRRLKAGAARDHLLGVECVTGYGQAIKSGGRVVKNVTGYDLPKLLAGSFGTLAVLTRVIFKVLPTAEASTTLLVRGLGEVELLGCLRMAMQTSFEVSGAAVLPPLAGGRSTVKAVQDQGVALACLRLEGAAPSVAYRADMLEKTLARSDARFVRLEGEDSQALWREIRDVRLLTPGRALWRLSIAPAAASELRDWLAEMSPERLYDWSGGLVWLAPKDTWAGAAETIRRAFEGRGGHATLVRASEELRREVEPFEPQPRPLRALTERVKKSFDPKRILNPGRMYAGI